jgi:hypothetical protein
MGACGVIPLITLDELINSTMEKYAFVYGSTVVTEHAYEATGKIDRQASDIESVVLKKGESHDLPVRVPRKTIREDSRQG